MDKEQRIALLEQIIDLGINGYTEEALHPKSLDPIPLIKRNLGAANAAIKILNEMSQDISSNVNITISVIDPEPIESSADETT